MLAAQVAVEVHLAQADGMRLVIAVADRWDGIDSGLVRYCGQATNSSFDRATEVWRIHRQSNVHGAEVAGDVTAHFLITQVIVERGRRINLQNLGAQVRHVDATSLYWVRIVYGVLKHDVWVTGFELQLSNGLEEVTCVDFLLGNTGVFDHFCVVLRNGDITKWLAVDALNVIRAKQVHIFIALSQVEGDVWNDNSQRQGLDADLLVSVFALGVEEVQDIWVVSVQVHCTGALTRTQLVSVRKCVFQHLHDRDNARRLVFNVLNWRTGFADVAQQQCNATAALGQLQGGVNSASDGFHVVFDAQQEAGNKLATLCLASIEEGWGCWLEATRHDFINHAFGNCGVTVREEKRSHRHAIFEALQVTTTVEGL